MTIVREPPRQFNIRNVRLSKKSKESLSGMKYSNRRISDVIEDGNWWIPCNTCLYSRLKTEFERGMHEFFGIPKNKTVEVVYMDSDMLSYEDGIYPERF